MSILFHTLFLLLLFFVLSLVLKTGKLMVRSLFFCCILATGITFAQNRVNDAAAWLSTTLNKKVNKKLSASLVVRNRFSENFTRYNYFFVGLGVDYKLGGDFRLSAMYAFNPAKNAELLFVNNHKFYLGISKKFTINKYFSFSDRIMLRETTSDHLFNNASKPSYNLDVRNKVEAEYKLGSKRSFYISDELWWRPKNGSWQFRRNRLRAGYNTDIAKNLSADIYFMLQQSFGKSGGNTNDFIYGLSLEYTLK